MKKMAIIYSSVHHYNTEKLVQCAKGLDIYNVCENSQINLSDYDLVGFASGIYMGKFHKSIDNYIKEHLKELNNIFLVYTSGSGSKKYGTNYKKELEQKGIKVLNIYSCKGYDTFGIFKLIGGISKNHPNQNDIHHFLEFINNFNN